MLLILFLSYPRNALRIKMVGKDDFCREIKVAFWTLTAILPERPASHAREAVPRALDVRVSLL